MFGQIHTLAKNLGAMDNHYFVFETSTLLEAVKIAIFCKLRFLAVQKTKLLVSND